MISGMANLYTQTKESIAKLRGINIHGVIDPVETSCVVNRAVQICALEAILFEHRKKYGTQFNNLSGKNALHHKLLLKYQWSLPSIREMNLFDSLLALQDELRFESLPNEISVYLSGVTSTNYPNNFPDYLPEEWDPELASKYLTERQS